MNNITRLDLFAALALPYCMENYHLSDTAKWALQYATELDKLMSKEEPKPQESDKPKHRYPWHLAPENAICAATDQNGCAYWYTCEKGNWGFDSGGVKIKDKFDATDWQNSLEIRPEEFR